MRPIPIVIFVIDIKFLFSSLRISCGYVSRLIFKPASVTVKIKVVFSSCKRDPLDSK